MFTVEKSEDYRLHYAVGFCARHARRDLLHARMDCRYFITADVRRPVSAAAGEEGRGA